MLKDSEIPATLAGRELRKFGVAFNGHFYKYEEKGGTGVSARELGVDEHAVIKTLIMETEDRAPMIVLMHGDCQVSTKALARTPLVLKRCNPAVRKSPTGN